MSSLSLEIVEGPGAGRRVQLSAPLEIGRQQGVGLVLDDELASRRHARLSPAETGVIVEDLDSLNGTFVDGNQIYSPTYMTPGDQLLVGVTVLELRSAEQIASRPSAVRAIPTALAAPARPPDFVPVVGTRGQDVPELDPLLDIYTKARAKTAPLAIFVLVAIVVLLYIGLAAPEP